MKTMSTTRPLPAGCALLPTEPLRLLVLAAPTAIENKRIVCVSGSAGCGKTVALDVLANDLTLRNAGRVVPVELLHSATDKQVISSLVTAVTGAPVLTRISAGDLSIFLRHLLAAERIILMIDEAQHASNRALEVVRQVHEDPTSRSGLVLAGLGLIERLAKQPTLDSRVGLRVKFAPVDDQQLIPLVQALHPLLRTLSAERIYQINDKFADGSLRHWTQVLEWLVAITPAGQAPGEEHIRQALALATGESWYP